MTWKRVPHQLVLAFVFSAIALVFAAAIVKGTFRTLHDADGTIAYAAGELRGLRSITRVQTVLNRLVDYRTDLVAGTSHTAAGRARAVRERRAIAAAIVGIEAEAGAKTPLDDAMAEPLAALERTWAAVGAAPGASTADVSAAIARVQPLLVAIQTASGIANDPSMDGQNFGDALIRFPLSLADGTAAASIALTRLAAADTALPPRFAVTRLLAQAQTAVNVGREDAADEIVVDPAAGAPLARGAAANAADFAELQAGITATYVDPAGSHRAGADRVMLAELRTFTASSEAIVDALGRNLFRVVDDRIVQAREADRGALIGGAIRLCLEVFTLLTLAGICIASYQTARVRMAAERSALESQRAELESELTHARAQQELLRAKAQFRAVFDYAPTGMIIVDRQCRIVEMNGAARAIFDAAAEPSPTLMITDHAPIIDGVFTGSLERYCAERKYVDRADALRWFDISIAPVYAEPDGVLFAVLMVRDVTENKSLEARLVFDAGHDALTGLPNRNYFLALLQQALDRRRAASCGDVFSVVFIDFNDFKTINDSFGHAAGDMFLIEGSARLRDSVRSTDVIARIGGDEFAVMLYGSDRADIEKSVVRLQSVLAVPVNIEGQLVASSASFGVAQAEPGYTLAAEIIRDADTAMYQAKSQGGRDYVVFDQSMREKVVRRMQLSIDIVKALEHGELELLYQPIVNLISGKLAGCEALVRWRRGDGSLILPTEFIPLAEENGSIIDIGHWVTTTACAQLQAWNRLTAERGLHLPADFVVHLNLAVPEVHHIDLLATLERTLRETGVRRGQLILEITEGIVLKNTLHMRSTLDALTRAGFRLCIDDFGTGYSSLRYLNDLPLHSFKIDRSFVSNGGDDLANTSIVEMLMVLSRSLGLGVVAEGIETQRQWRKLRDLGCERGQGFLFAPPVDAAALNRMLESDCTFQPGAPGARFPGALHPDGVVHQA